MFYNNQFTQFTQPQMGFHQNQGFQGQQQQHHSSQFFNAYQGQQQQQQQQQAGNMNQIFAPKPINNNNGAFIQNQFVKSSSPMQLNQFASFSSNNQDQYSENSTSCGSDENNQDDFLDQMPQLQQNLSIKNMTIPSPALGGLNQQQAQNAASSQKNAKTAPVPVNAVIPEEAKYKTEMCKNWVETGKCNYGEKCKFAHGKNELVQKIAANKHFKTKRCKQYYETCVCNYGPRCHFVHDIRSVSEIQANNEYAKKLLNPELFLDLSSSSPSSLTSSSSSTTSSSSNRLSIFQKLTSSSLSSISTTTSQ